MFNSILLGEDGKAAISGEHLLADQTSPEQTSSRQAKDKKKWWQAIKPTLKVSGGCETELECSSNVGTMRPYNMS